MWTLTHLVAAVSLAVAITGTYVAPTHPSTVFDTKSIPAPKQNTLPKKECMTVEDVAKKVKGTAPRFDLTGADLEAFHANYKVVAKRAAPPDVDRVMVWGEGESDQHTLLFVSFFKGCVTHAFFVPADEFLKILNGNRA